MERVDVKQHGKGYLRIWFRMDGFDKIFRTKIDLGTQNIYPKPVFEIRFGIPVYSIIELVELKLQTLVGERPRMQARDIYDAAWIVKNHPECVAGKTMHDLQIFVSNLSNDKIIELKRLFENDIIMGKVEFDGVMLSLMNSLEHLQAKPPNKTIEMDSGSIGKPQKSSASNLSKEASWAPDPSPFDDEDGFM